MRLRVRRNPSACLVLLITAILGAGYAPAQAEAAPTKPYLVFSTYLGGTTAVAGGTARTFAQNVACDAQGNVYVTGGTEVTDLPGTDSAFQSSPAPNSAMSAFVAKYDPTGTMLWCTYLGGDAHSMGTGVAAMPDGGVAVIGLTSSGPHGPFPTKNAFQPQYHGNADYFVTVFDQDGKLRYSTYLGGGLVEGTAGKVFSDNNSNGNNIAVDAAGLVYVTGTTGSGYVNATIPFPNTPNAIQPSSLYVGEDAFMCIINPAKSGPESLVYSSILGGTMNDKGHSIAVDTSGTYITAGGYTRSWDFPTTDNAYRKDPPDDFDSNGYLTQVVSSLPGDPSSVYTLRYSTYLGGTKDKPRDDVYGMVMSPTGLIVATGRTQSADFPMTDGGPSIFNSAGYLRNGVSSDEPFLVKIDPSQSGKASLVYATFLGGGDAEGKWGSFCTSVGVDARGTAYVAGETYGNPGAPYVPPGHPIAAPEDFPYTLNALFTTLQGGFDAVFMQIDPTGYPLNYSTFLGGSANDRTYGLAVDPTGPNVVLSGLTSSDDFPVVNAAQIWPGNTGCQNAFVAKFSLPGATARRMGHVLELLLLGD